MKTKIIIRLERQLDKAKNWLEYLDEDLSNDELPLQMRKEMLYQKEELIKNDTV